MVALPLISEVLRTPEECFFNLPDYPFAAHYTELGGLRIAHVDECTVSPLGLTCTKR